MEEDFAAYAKAMAREKMRKVMHEFGVITGFVTYAKF